MTPTTSQVLYHIAKQNGLTLVHGCFINIYVIHSFRKKHICDLVTMSAFAFERLFKVVQTIRNSTYTNWH